MAGVPLTIRLSGLDCMGDDPTDMHVLYLKVQDDPSGRLAALCKLAVAAFEQAGLLGQQPQHKVKLHATIINTRHRRQQHDGPQQHNGQQHHQKQQHHQTRQGFDGTALLKQHACLDVGEVQLPSLAISQRGVYDVASGYYAALDTLPLT